MTEVFVDEAQFTFEPKQTQQGNGYPTEQMYAPKADKPQTDDFDGFTVFNDDGVPF